LAIGDGEHQAEADLAKHLLARGIQPFVLLVAFDERIKRYRHPTPGMAHLKKCAMLVVCGQRHGLIANVTRLVHFGPLPAELAQRHEAVCKVEAAFWEATVPGATYGAVMEAGIAAYKKHGFAKEWELHHQGGPTGYAGRDFLAVPGEKRKVLDRQAVAWNPSITGTKTEDTFIIEGGARTVITACSPDWPTLTVTVAGAKVARPGILVR
jgi:Xaa-Pro aminopeptidase